MKCPYTGENCNYPPVVHVTDIKNGEVIHTQMCGGCGSNFMENSKQPIPIEDKPPNIITNVYELLDALIGKGISPPEIDSKKPDPCPSCGITLEEFNYIGKFGCPQCYIHYKDEFDSLSVMLHGSKEGVKLTHVGKRPKHHRHPDNLVTLKLKLTRAIEHERFEEAEQIKLEIEKLTNDPNKL